MTSGFVHHEGTTMDELPGDAMDDATHHILNDGYLIEWTGVTSPLHPYPRAWTVGRTLSERPELLVSGLGKDTSQELIDAFVIVDDERRLQPDMLIGSVTIIDAEPAAAMGAVARFPTPSLLVYQLVWATVIDGLIPDQDQKVYVRGATILTDPYGAP